MTGIRKTGRQIWRDANWFPEVEAAPEAKSLVWLNSGTQRDIERARDYAAGEGYTVLTYATTERNPLVLARAAVLDANS